MCAASPLLSWQAVVQGRQTASLSQDRCVLAALSAPSLGSPPPSPLTHPSRALSVECPVPAGIASLLSSLRLLVAAFALTKKGLRCGFHNCCGGICHLSYVWCASGLEMPPAPLRVLPVKALTRSAWDRSSPHYAHSRGRLRWATERSGTVDRSCSLESMSLYSTHWM